MTIAFPTLIISRRSSRVARAGTMPELVGGKPRLGRQPWPRNARPTLLLHRHGQQGMVTGTVVYSEV